MRSSSCAAWRILQMRVRFRGSPHLVAFLLHLRQFLAQRREPHRQVVPGHRRDADLVLAVEPLRQVHVERPGPRGLALGILVVQHDAVGIEVELAVGLIDAESGLVNAGREVVAEEDFLSGLRVLHLGAFLEHHVDQPLPLHVLDVDHVRHVRDGAGSGRGAACCRAVLPGHRATA